MPDEVKVKDVPQEELQKAIDSVDYDLPPLEADRDLNLMSIFKVPVQKGDTVHWIPRTQRDQIAVGSRLLHNLPPEPKSTKAMMREHQRNLEHFDPNQTFTSDQPSYGYF
ncbi:hypothetical protein EES43_25445 [Streptomyces sp. ADI96-02]|nr:hypothetical protein EES43_25445 [Streptomyces sp. ADI96-02]